MLRLLIVIAFLTSSVVRPSQGLASAVDEISSDSREFVVNKVLPLLESRCFECHRDPGKHKGGLLLTSRAALLKGGDSGPAIVPGRPDESLLIEAVRYEGFEMPPRSRMPVEEVAILVQWISDGAPWPVDVQLAADAEIGEDFSLEDRRNSHWSWRPITDPSIPRVGDSTWVIDPVDAFILARLEDKGVRPAADADRRILIRRLYFDLIGLPPTIAQVESFVSDSSSDDKAIARVVDELLASPHFGERWGRHWLDLVRYAESLGHEFDFPLHHAWRYRDYVIRAFNADVSYDQLIREHIAGDLLINPRRHPEQEFNESIIGTGFWMMCEDKHAPVDVRGEEAARIDNQIDVFSKAFLGLTVACARCHDHKFDAISTKDYYALSGFLQSSRRQTAWLDPHRRIEKRVEQIHAAKESFVRCVTEDLNRDLILSTTGKYLPAALEAIHGEPLKKPANQAPPVLFADFESSRFDGWIVSGDSFSSGPSGPRGAQRMNGQKGKLANSYADTDAVTGRMKSRPFVIEHSVIEFLVGGGDHAGKTCVNLIVNDQVVRSQTGNNSDILELKQWDVSEFRGVEASIEIVDDHSGGWGHIEVDHIMFRNVSDRGPNRSISVVAEETNCDRTTLNNWVQVLLDPESKSLNHPLSSVATIAQSNDARAQDRTLVQWASRVQSESGNVSETEMFADLRSGIPQGWFAFGPAFSERPESTETVSAQITQSEVQIQSEAAVSSAALSPELRGTLSSPTFELQHPEILILASGKSARVRLVIDGYVMHEFSDLLFKGAKHDIDTDGKFRWIRLADDVHRYVGHRMYIEFMDEGDGWFEIQEIRFATSPAAKPPQVGPSAWNQLVAGQAGNLLFTLNDRNPPQEFLAVAFENALLEPANTRQAMAAAKNWLNAARKIPAPVPVIALTEGTEEDEHVFIRGNHKNPGEVAGRAFLEAISGKQSAITTGSGRRELVDRMLSDENPYPARVAVNRIWHHLFGRGIVPSADNFGVLGQKPSHPELLDHLAYRFRAGGWSIKSLIRTLVMSRTYRLSSVRSRRADQLDPTNELLHRARIRRLEGETIRDSILHISGSLRREQFGSPVPVFLTPHMQGRGKPKSSGPLDGNGRRSIYVSVNRNFLSPFMLAFDVPAPVTTMGRRGTSNVPAQALIMMNNEFVEQQSVRWAELLQAEGRTLDKAIDTAWRQAFGRAPRQSEMEKIQQFARSQTLERGSQSDRPDLSVMADICHAILNSKEFVFLN